MTGLSFLRPWWLLALVPWAVAGVALLRRRAAHGPWASACEPALLEALRVDGGRRAWRLPAALALSGWLLTVLALAGPRSAGTDWGPWLLAPVALIAAIGFRRGWLS